MMEEGQPETNSEPNNEVPIRVDFKDTIERLEQRAKRSRKRVIVLSTILFFSIIMITFLISSLITYPSLAGIEFRALNDDSRASIEAPFTRRVKYLMEELIGPINWRDRENFKKPDEETSKRIKAELE